MAALLITYADADVVRSCFGAKRRGQAKAAMQTTTTTSKWQRERERENRIFYSSQDAAVSGHIHTPTYIISPACFDCRT